MYNCVAGRLVSPGEGRIGTGRRHLQSDHWQIRPPGHPLRKLTRVAKRPGAHRPVGNSLPLWTGHGDIRRTPLRAASQNRLHRPRLLVPHSSDDATIMPMRFLIFLVPGLAAAVTVNTDFGGGCLGRIREGLGDSLPPRGERGKGPGRPQSPGQLVLLPCR